jgi:hypothetical protein
MRIPSIVLFVLLLFSSCKESEEKKSNDIQIELKAFISLLEYDFRLLEEQIQTLGKEVKLLLENKDQILEANPDHGIRFIRGIGNNKGLDNSKGSTIYISDIGKVYKKEIDELLAVTQPLDELFREIVENNEVVSQVYFNSKYQVNRLFPPYDAISMLEPDLDLRKFNFYYLALEENNPEKTVVWVDEIYIDPVGRGWMISLLYPVYYDDEFIMVLGFDITLNDIINSYLHKFERNFVLVDATGTLVAGKTKAIEALSMPPLKNHTYTQTITSDSFRMEDFNLFRSKSKRVRQMASSIILSNEKEQRFTDYGVEIKVRAEKMDILNWYLLDIDF